MKYKFDKRLLLAAGLVGVSGVASAQVANELASVLAEQPASSAAAAPTAQVQINATSFAQATAISGALGSRFFGFGAPGPVASLDSRGLAAGGAGRPFTVWGNLSNADTQQSYNAFANNIRNNSTVLNSVIGADYALSPDFVVGVSAALDRGNLNSQNITGGGARIESTTKGYVIAPYAAYQLNKQFAVDASVGIGQGRFYGANDVSAESDRWFGAANLTYNRWYGNVQFLGKLSYLHGEEKYGDNKKAGATDPGTGVKNKIDQTRLGIQAGYWLNGGFMPYVGVSYVNDMRRTNSAGLDDPIGRDAWVGTVGVNYFSLAKGVTAGIAYNQEESRSNQKYNNLMANVSIRF
ncbi:autotransporter outer membrane beta-barrel domain-containing protein [Rhodocyclus purpureus]|uniref:autotransporter outer membrane beta-barrel domain-containing protein n=1 Tax=Rhodocyclus purpureus TaxID=1067 RepID=UPI0019125749|nr:autotransporter outer membrane beta-barrel domain-containing protein [Rhodocyclus purpureus]MBK5915650.1 hypothetical protein [Rhodocyclus purpureus]